MQNDLPSNPRAVILRLSTSIQETVGNRLVGLYLYGSLITGGYDDAVSDIDLLAVTTEDIDDVTLDQLTLMHTRLEADWPRWRSRVEVAYLSASALRSFKTRRSPMINISPGEPIHRITAGHDWLMNWYLVRTSGASVVGPSPTALVPDVSIAEFIEAVREHARVSGQRFHNSRNRKSQAYAILTMSRALHTVRSGAHHSKQDSAAWVQAEYPESAELIETALNWRKEPDDAPALPLHPAATAFLTLIRSHIIAG